MTIKSFVRALAVVAGLGAGIFGASLNAQANQITLGSSTPTWVVTSLGGGNVNFSTAGASGLGFFDLLAEIGPYVFGPVSLTAGPGPTAGGFYPANPPAAQSFSWTGAGGDSLAGTITWYLVQDDSPNPQLFGNMVITSLVAFNAAFAAAFADLRAVVDVTFQSLGMTLDELAAQAAGFSRTVGLSSGEIVPVPGPIIGAGLPGLILACGGLIALARRRRRQMQMVA